jgi:hypothetical protein
MSKPQERLWALEKEMQDVMLSQFEKEFGRHEDCGDALAFANEQANQWYQRQVRIDDDPGLLDHVSRRPFNKREFFKRFEKVDAAVDAKQYQMISRYHTTYHYSSGTCFERATSGADWQGKKYRQVKETLAQ